ncbi:hypothetical protein [Jiangella asiatica]|uniref:Uncharacterized protein n=1 Tax=Jiangella asiatica TaxID=2530372 RepID=A0A4R5DJM9_9ACTN|nr:hypothetical protein [Jiangella asiatica]TDE13557.1 hypothetical protein E1269_05890 [Jiangella asiatica]
MATPTSPEGGAPTDELGRALLVVSFAMLGGVVMIAVLTLVALTDEPGTALDAATALVVSGVFLAAAWLMPRRLIRPWPASTAPDPVKAAGQLRTAAFLSLVFSELPALVGMVNSVARNAWLPVVIGAILSVFGLLATAPSGQRLRQWLAHLESQGARTGLRP